MESFDINKFSAELVNNNLEKFYIASKGIFKGAKNSIRVRLRNGYNNYLENVTNKYSKTKSFFLKSEPVFLYDFYIPLSLSRENKNVGKASIKMLNSISKHIIIVGAAGSGKSILMKHLFLDIIINNFKVPIFLELRDLNKKNITFEEFIIENLIINKIGFNREYLFRVFEAGHFVFLLDGFDEVDNKIKRKISNEIRRFIEIFDKNVFIVSSRPDHEFNGWQEFVLLETNSLTLDEASELINKLPFDDELKEHFLIDLKRELYVKHTSFLSNPLLLSIMLLTYGLSADIPNKLNIFYNQAYEALFQRHDTLKGAYQRERKCNLDIQDFARVFSGLSIQTYDKREFEFSRTQALSYLEGVKKIHQLDFNPNNYLDDALQAVCLLVEDGLFITYSHRSFQEYFVARFIDNCQIDIQKKLMFKYSTNIRSDSVLDLLYEINQENVEKLFILPKINELLEKIGYKKTIGITHFFRFMKMCLNEVGFFGDPHEMVYKLKPNGLNYFHILFFIRDKCGNLIKWKDWGGSSKIKINYAKKYRSIIKGKFIIIKDLNYTHPFVKDLYNYGSLFSKNTLINLIKIKKEIIEKQNKINQSLEQILFS